MSVRYITDDLPFGGVYRGIHRYAGDAMVLTIILHTVRVWFTDRYRQYRWVQWISGIVSDLHGALHRSDRLLPGLG